MSVLGKPVVRAAVYTRKSSDEGLDQEFNSLDAQHEACSSHNHAQQFVVFEPNVATISGDDWCGSIHIR